jgi:hypothetical protein
MAKTRRYHPGPYMRLVTYDRGGARRLGAWVDGTVVDLPDAVGHPSFPTTMEALVDHNGGTILDAADDVLWEPEVLDEFRVPNARLNVPYVPHAVRAARHLTPELAVFGPGDEVPWPDSGWLEFDFEVACLAGRGGRDLDPVEASGAIFGYTIVVEWWVRPASDHGSQNGRHHPYVGFSFGPWVVTADEFDPSEAAVAVRIDGRIRGRGKISATRSTFASTVAQASEEDGVRPGDLFGSGRPNVLSPTSWHLRPGSVVEVAVEGIGLLRTAVATRAGTPVEG